ncbi:uncharacterized protein B0T15DRAFT_578031 [Chaetomium strumarium]|uniref:Uncharacterized protein n=1 Tax=Chaetomium strumarium TaxID=1170767 RepID=A0AAJ0LXW1_9PEZI|nr:hypothetical protein B0T15DRAFT_578031 [Chaetomium strumarium]
MSSSISSPSSQYDPAYNTLGFDILAVLSLIRLKTPDCDACRQTLIGTAQQAFSTILAMPTSTSTATTTSSTTADSTIFSARVEPNDTTGLIKFITTANPVPISVADALLVRNAVNPDRTREMIDRVFDALLVPGQHDTFFGQLAHAQLWLVLDGTYTVADADAAMRGEGEGEEEQQQQQRSLGEFARSHMALLGALARAQGGELDPLPLATDICTACLGFQEDDALDNNMTGFPWGGELSLQTLVLQRKVEGMVKEWKEGADTRAAAVALMMPTNTELARWVRGEVGSHEQAACAWLMLQALTNQLMNISV